MLKLSDFVAGIEQSMEKAGRALADENFKMLRQFFHVNSADSFPLPDSPWYDVPHSNNNKQNAHVENSDFSNLTPKTVKMQFPVFNRDGGASVHEVHVPLITLVRTTNVELAEAEIEVDLEIIEKGDDVYVGFPQRRNKLFSSKGSANTSKPNAKMKIIMKAQEGGDGFSSIVEGYTKAVRAQIPS